MAAKQMERSYDVVVVGAGIGGLSTALVLAERFDVALVVKRDLMESATRHAQGGIAAVQGCDDNYDLHAEDTKKAGAGLCRPDVVDHVVTRGPRAMDDLRSWGVRFDEADEFPALAKEGGHSRRRVSRVKDQTGLAIQEALVERAVEHPRVHIFERHMAVDVLTRSRVDRGTKLKASEDRALGLYVLDLDEDEVRVIGARAVILATGGAGKVYRYTSNPDTASGDGVAMAYRAGARIANMEFFQFHPTCLYHPEAGSFLVSEALRGEGGILRTSDGTPFMKKIHRRADLAPRDIVARAIDHQMKTHGEQCVFLDMTHLSADMLPRRFPFIHARCLELGIDMREDPIPVVPAAHYLCGGVQVDLRGRSTVPGLWAIGETSCTGLHGANRLASNSLLEGAVYGRAAADDVCALEDAGELPRSREDLPAWTTGFARPLTEAVLITESWNEVRRVMMSYVGIVRSNQRLDRARRRIEMLRSEVYQDYWDTVLTGDLVELRNLVTVADLIIECALARRESRGLHFNVDYPSTDDRNWLRDTVIWRGQRGEVLQDLVSL